MNPTDKALARKISTAAPLTPAQPDQGEPGAIGVVQAINSDGTLTVQYNGAPCNCETLTDFVPAVGESVLVEVFGTQLWVMGPVTPAGEWNEFAYVNSWADYSSGTYSPSGYRKLPNGLVVVEGAVTGGSSVLFATLPAGYRPRVNLVITVLVNLASANQLGYVNVAPTGALTVSTPANVLVTVAWINFTFFADE